MFNSQFLSGIFPERNGWIPEAVYYTLTYCLFSNSAEVHILNIPRIKILDLYFTAMEIDDEEKMLSL